MRSLVVAGVMSAFVVLARDMSAADCARPTDEGGFGGGPGRVILKGRASA